MGKKRDSYIFEQNFCADDARSIVAGRKNDLESESGVIRTVLVKEPQKVLKALISTSALSGT